VQLYGDLNPRPEIAKRMDVNEGISASANGLADHFYQIPPVFAF
jgi:hypothetical protein